VIMTLEPEQTSRKGPNHKAALAWIESITDLAGASARVARVLGVKLEVEKSEIANS
jgi:hypothetical protein